MRVGIIGLGNFTENVFVAMNHVAGITVVGGYESIQAKNFTTFSTLDQLIDEVDMVMVLDLLSCQFDTLSHVIRSSKHLYIESPGLFSRRDLNRLELLANEAGVVLQIGLKQRFYDFFNDLDKYEVQPRIIESRRYVKFNTNSTQLSVVDDLMQHDIDIALKLVNAEVKSVRSTAVGVYYKDPDVVHTRIEFYNGCVANLSASKIADKEVHRKEVFQEKFHCSINYLAQLIKVQSNLTNQGDLNENWGVRTNYSQEKDDYIYTLTKEIQSFVSCITKNVEPIAGISQYLQLQSVTDKIKEQLERNFTTNV